MTSVRYHGRLWATTVEVELAEGGGPSGFCRFRTGGPKGNNRHAVVNPELERAPAERATAPASVRCSGHPAEQALDGRVMTEWHAAGQPGQAGIQPAGHQASLSGTGLVADDLYLLAHDDRTGRRCLGPRSLGIGLAGALLADLMLGDSIGLQRGGTIVAHRRRPDDDLGQRVHAQIAAEGEPRPVRDLLLFFARNAAADVARRLEQAGYLEHVRSWIPGRPGHWVPLDINRAYAPLIRVRSALDPSRALDPRHAVLAGLTWASRLDKRVTQAGPTGQRGVDEAVSYLIPGLRFVITQTQVAVDSTLLAHRP